MNIKFKMMFKEGWRIGQLQDWRIQSQMLIIFKISTFAIRNRFMVTYYILGGN